MTCITGQRPGYEAIVSGTAAKIEDTVTGADIRKVNRDPAPQTHVSIRNIPVEVVVAFIEGTDTL
jgi:hypothetical protein